MKRIFLFLWISSLFGLTSGQFEDDAKAFDKNMPNQELSTGSIKDESDSHFKDVIKNLFMMRRLRFKNYEILTTGTSSIDESVGLSKSFQIYRKR